MPRASHLLNSYTIQIIQVKMGAFKDILENLRIEANTRAMKYRESKKIDINS